MRSRDCRTAREGLSVKACHPQVEREFFRRVVCEGADHKITILASVFQVPLVDSEFQNQRFEIKIRLYSLSFILYSLPTHEFSRFRVRALHRSLFTHRFLHRRRERRTRF